MKKVFLSFVLVLILIQFIRIDKTNLEVDNRVTLATNERVLSILQRSCYDCHSNETVWSIYSDIAPLSFFIKNNVENGRNALNFSLWNKIDSDKKRERLKRAVMLIKNELMAPSAYKFFHKNTVLSNEEKVLLVEWFKQELELVK